MWTCEKSKWSTPWNKMWRRSQYQNEHKLYADFSHKLCIMLTQDLDSQWCTLSAMKMVCLINNGCEWRWITRAWSCRAVEWSTWWINIVWVRIEKYFPYSKCNVAMRNLFLSGPCEKLWAHLFSFSTTFISEGYHQVGRYCSGSVRLSKNLIADIIFLSKIGGGISYFCQKYKN